MRSIILYFFTSRYCEEQANGWKLKLYPDFMFTDSEFIPIFIPRKRYTMKYICIFLVLFSCSGIMSGQQANVVDRKLRAQLDSVLAEGNLLYFYEKAAWVSYDLVARHPELRNRFETYLTYQTGKSIRTIVLGNNWEKCLAEFTFTTDYDQPEVVRVEERKLTSYEKKLIYIRKRLLAQLTDEKYGLDVPEGFHLNFTLIPSGKKYKLYVLTGTSDSHIIPFGNDYLFIADNYGNVEKWRKFHAELIPEAAGHEDEKRIELTHSHTASNPLISATDICTFMLYGSLYGLERLSVYSDGRYMEYNMETNEIRVKVKR